MDKIVHICSEEDWQAAQSVGEYQADSLQAEGFIHCSRPEQVVEVANRYYGGSTNLLLLWMDPSTMAAEIRWEASDGDIYPHVYGSLKLNEIIQVTAFLPNNDGVFRSLPDL